MGTRVQEDQTPTSPTQRRADGDVPEPLFGASREVPDQATTGTTTSSTPARDTDGAADRSPLGSGGVATTAAGDEDATTAIPAVTTTRPRRDAELAPLTGSDHGTPDGVTVTPADDGTSRRRWWLLAIPLVLVLGLGLWIGTLFQERAGRAMPGVTVEGFDASGMTGDEIGTRLQEVVADRREATITITAADQTWEYSLGDEGYTADVEGTVDEALSAGRDGPVASVLNHVRASRGQTSWDVELAGVDIDRDVDELLATIDDEVDVDPTAGSVSLDPETLEVSSEVPQEGLDARPEDVRDELVGLLGTGASAELDIEVVTIPPEVDPANVEATVARTEAVLDESYVLTSGDDSVTVDPSELAPALSIVETDEGYDLALDRDAVRELLADGRGDKFDVSPRSASYEVVSGARTFDDKGSATFDPSPAQVDVVEGRNGREFNPDVATDLLVSLFEAEEHRGEFELDVVEPSFTTDEARAARPDALLGTFTTYHDAGGPRVFNIHLLADMIDGEVLPPGDDFSVNRDIGDRNEAKGFKAAGAIKDGEIIDDDIGGGVSQLATTFYNAAFFAGIDVLSWQPHSLPIDRYPLAREATFSYAGGLDIHILNDTEGALVVTTDYTDTSITVSIFGQDDGRTVTAVMGEPRDYRDFDVVRRTTDEIAPGATRTVQTGAEGFTVDYERVIEGGTNPGTEQYSWAYSPKPTIIETGEG
jgi:vancomycin resistance protein YoaR